MIGLLSRVCLRNPLTSWLSDVDGIRAMQLTSLLRRGGGVCLFISLSRSLSLFLYISLSVTHTLSLYISPSVSPPFYLPLPLKTRLGAMITNGTEHFMTTLICLMLDWIILNKILNGIEYFKCD